MSDLRERLEQVSKRVSKLLSVEWQRREVAWKAARETLDAVMDQLNQFSQRETNNSGSQLEAVKGRVHALRLSLSAPTHEEHKHKTLGDDGRYHDHGCPYVADDEGDMVLADYGECVCGAGEPPEGAEPPNDREEER